MRVMAPVSLAAWLSGDLGKRVQSQLETHLHGLDNLRVARIMGGFVAQANESETCLVHAVAESLRSIEASFKNDWPTLYQEVGPLFTGHVQVVLDEPPWLVKPKPGAAREQER